MKGNHYQHSHPAPKGYELKGTPKTKTTPKKAKTKSPAMKKGSMKY